MSDSQTYEPVTVGAHGVTVAKRFEADEFPVPAIAFRITSDRSETVSVKIVDSVPEDVAVEDLGFHPEYGSEYWTIDDQQITFERDIEAESEYTTVYGIRSTGTDNVEQFLTEPVIETVDPPLEDDEGDVLDESSSDVVKDVIAGSSDSVPGLDDEDEEEIETLNLKDPNSPGGEAADGETAEGEEGGGGAGGARVTHALLREIKRGEIEDEILTALRQTLVNGSGGGGGGAVDARIQHLQNEVSDLSAYTESLEQFLAENGTGEQMITDFRNQLNAFQDELDDIQSMAVKNQDAVKGVQSKVTEVDNRVGSVEGSVESVDNQVGSLDNRVGSLDEKVESLDETVGSMEGDVGSVKGDVNEMKEEFDTVQQDVNSMDERVGDIEGTVESVEGRVDGMDADVNDVQDSLDSLEGELNGLQNELQDVTEQIGDVSNVDNRIDDIEDEIEQLKQWREQLSSVIGGGGD